MSCNNYSKPKKKFGSVIGTTFSIKEEIMYLIFLKKYHVYYFEIDQVDLVNFFT